MLTVAASVGLFVTRLASFRCSVGAAVGTTQIVTVYAWHWTAPIPCIGISPILLLMHV